MRLRRPYIVGARQAARLRAVLGTSMTSLRTKLLAVLLVVCGGFGLGIGWLILSSTEERVLSEAKTKLSQTAARQRDRVDSSFKEKEALGLTANQLAAMAVFKPDGDPHKAHPYARDAGGALRGFSDDGVSGAFLSSRTKLTPRIERYLADTERMWSALGPIVAGDFFNLYVITEDNFIRISPPDWAMRVESDHDFSGDLFYYLADAQHNPKRWPVWTPVYYDSIIEKWMVSLIVPLYDGETFFGITGSDYTLDQMLASIGAIGPQENDLGKTFLFDEQNNILSHPDYDDAIRQRQAAMNTIFTFRDVREKGLSDVIAHRTTADFNEDGVARYWEGEETYWVCVKPLASQPWNIAVYSSQAELTHDLAGVRRNLLAALAAAVVLVAGTLAVAIRRTVLNRLLALEQAVRAFGQGQTPHYPPAGGDELGRLSQAFQAMAGKLGQHRENLEREVAEKTRDLLQKNERLQKLIAERERAEASLRVSEDRYRTLVECAPLGITRVSAEHEILMVNPALAKMVHKTPAELVGQKCYRAFEHRDEICPHCPGETVMRTGRPAEAESDVTDPDGNHRVVRMIAVPLFDPDGHVFGYIEIVEDITERKLAEVALRDSEIRQRTILECIQTGFMIIDAETHVVVEANPAALRLIGAPRENVVGRVCHHFVCPAEQGRCPITDLGQVVDCSERALLTADGQSIPILKNVTVLTLEGRDYLLESFVDLREQKRAMQQLQASEERYRAITETAQDAIMTVDAQGRVCLWNTAAEKIFGYTAEEIIGQPIAEYIFPADSDGAGLQGSERILDIVGGSAPGRTMELTACRKEGVEFPVEVSASTYQDKDGQVTVVLLRDISRRKQTEAELVKHRDHLEELVKTATAESNEATRRLQDEMKERLRAAERIAQLNDLRGRLIGPSDFIEKLKIITDGVVSVFGADFARIWMTRPGDRCASGCVHADATEGPHVCRERDRCLHLLASSGRYTHLDGEVHRRVPFGCYKIGRIASSEDAKFLTNDAENDPRVHNHAWARELGLVSFAGYRLMGADGKPMGVLALFSQRPITPEEDALLEGLAHTTEQVLNNALAEEKIRLLNESLEHRVETRTAQLVSTNEVLRQEIADRERVEEALRERESTMRAITTSAQDAIIMMDADGGVSFWNPAAERILGWTEVEAMGRNIHEFITPERFQDAHRRAFPHFQRTGEGAAVGKTLDLVAVRKDEVEIPVELSLSAIQLGGRWHAISVMRDTTERKEAEAKLAAMNQQLMAASRQAGMAEAATGVLHNVGNVLNSVNVSASLAADQVRASRVPYVGKVAEMINQHVEDLGGFVAHDEKGRKLPAYLTKLAEHLAQEQASVLVELNTLVQKVDHVKEIVAQQQALARGGTVAEDVTLVQLVDEAIRLCNLDASRHGIELVREFVDTPRLRIDKHKFIQILINLLRNAKDALKQKGGEGLRVTVRVETTGSGTARVVVRDNGVGIAPDHVTRIFTHGFTTKKRGHGFGLHGSALLANELGGRLSVEAAGLNEGASFVLELPLEPVETPQ